MFKIKFKKCFSIILSLLLVTNLISISNILASEIPPPPPPPPLPKVSTAIPIPTPPPATPLQNKVSTASPISPVRAGGGAASRGLSSIQAGIPLKPKPVASEEALTDKVLKDKLNNIIKKYFETNNISIMKKAVNEDLDDIFLKISDGDRNKLYNDLVELNFQQRTVLFNIDSIGEDYQILLKDGTEVSFVDYYKSTLETLLSTAKKDLEKTVSETKKTSTDTPTKKPKLTAAELKAKELADKKAKELADANLLKQYTDFLDSLEIKQKTLDLNSFEKIPKKAIDSLISLFQDNENYDKYLKKIFITIADLSKKAQADIKLDIQVSKIKNLKLSLKDLAFRVDGKTFDIKNMIDLFNEFTKKNNPAFWAARIKAIEAQALKDSIAAAENAKKEILAEAKARVDAQILAEAKARVDAEKAVELVEQLKIFDDFLNAPGNLEKIGIEKNQINSDFRLKVYSLFETNNDEVFKLEDLQEKDQNTRQKIADLETGNPPNKIEEKAKLNTKLSSIEMDLRNSLKRINLKLSDFNNKNKTKLDLSNFKELIKNLKEVKDKAAAAEAIAKETELLANAKDNGVIDPELKNIIEEYFDFKKTINSGISGFLPQKQLAEASIKRLLKKNPVIISEMEKIPFDKLAEHIKQAYKFEVVTLIEPVTNPSGGEAATIPILTSEPVLVPEPPKPPVKPKAVEVGKVEVGRAVGGAVATKPTLEALIKAAADAKAKLEASQALVLDIISKLKDKKAEIESLAKQISEAKGGLQALDNLEKEAEYEALQTKAADAKAKYEALKKVAADAKTKFEALIKASADAKAMADAKAVADAQKVAGEAVAKPTLETLKKAAADAQAKFEALTKVAADAQAKFEALKAAEVAKAAKAAEELKTKKSSELASILQNTQQEIRIKEVNAEKYSVSKILTPRQKEYLGEFASLFVEQVLKKEFPELKIYKKDFWSRVRQWLTSKTTNKKNIDLAKAKVEKLLVNIDKDKSIVESDFYNIILKNLTNNKYAEEIKAIKDAETELKAAELRQAELRQAELRQAELRQAELRTTELRV